MSGLPTRVAVQVGSSTLRVACAASEGEPWLVAELPGPGPGTARLLAELFGPAPAELVVVHPASWPASRSAVLAREIGGLAGRVSVVAAPVAAVGAGHRIVLDVGHAGTEITRLSADGSILECRTCPVGGARLDDVLLARLTAAGGSRMHARGSPLGCSPGLQAGVRRLREELSLLPVAEVRSPDAAGPLRMRSDEPRDALAAVLGEAVGVLLDMRSRGGPAPVLVIGGVARTPLLAELLDEAGVDDVRVAPVPDAVAVLGALRPARPLTRAAARVPAPVARARLPGPPARKRRLVRAVLWVPAAAGFAAALLALGALLPAPPSAGAASVPNGVLVQYGYRLDVPAGWEHTGGLPERRRSLLSPVAAPEGSDVIAVERTPLGYDTGSERERARAELRAEFDAAVARGSRLSDYRVATHVAGRQVVSYRQRDADGRTEVDWFVVLDGDAQLSIGCRHTPAAAEAVRAACAVVVGSVRRG